MAITIKIESKNPLFEGLISKDAYLAYRYSKEILKKRWLKAENTISKSPYYAYKYAKDVLQKPWPIAEPYIALEPESSFLYARDLIKGRWEKGEKGILKPWNFKEKFVITKIEEMYIHPTLLARRIINRNYPVGEENIFYYAGLYNNLLKKKKEPKNIIENFKKKWINQLLKFPKAISLRSFDYEDKIPDQLHNAAVLLINSPHDQYEKDWLTYYFNDFKNDELVTSTNK